MQVESVFNRMTHAEKEVACVLQELRIHWSYEQPVFVWDEQKRPRVWTPDFYLHDFGVYVEVCGSKNFDYEYRRKVFERNGYQVIFLHVYEKSQKWKKHLFEYLWFFLDYRYKKFMKISCSAFVTN
jgi:hypothetical protein